MPKGGHGRSGPQPDEQSLTSARKGVSFTALPSEGYQGEAPEFPLPGASSRELEVWSDAWRTPQAAAWSMQPWRWRTVALWVRWSVRVEDPEASAALGQVVVRFADQIGLTPAGLKENGWKISSDDLAEQREEQQQKQAKPGVKSRLKVVNSDDEGS